MSTRKCQRCGDVAKFVRDEWQWKCVKCGFRFRYTPDGDLSFRHKAKRYEIPRGVKLVFPKRYAKDCWDEGTKNAPYWKARLEGKRGVKRHE